MKKDHVRIKIWLIAPMIFGALMSPFVSAEPDYFGTLKVKFQGAKEKQS